MKTKPQKVATSTIVTVALMIVVLVGVGLIYSTERQNTVELQKIIKQDNDKISALISENASKSAEITHLLSQPTPMPISQPKVQLPYWCETVIQGYVNSGFSRAVTNQLLKKDNPECAY
jgi:hypothetical protein